MFPLYTEGPRESSVYFFEERKGKMRKLASIQKIEWVRPIEGRDRIELAGVLGYSVIIRKDEFAPGDLCVFCEIDSVLPEKPEFEFLRPKKFRIKTMKLGSAYSQGIVFGLDILPRKKSGESYVLDEDVTDVIGVTQYTPTMDREPDELVAKQSKKYPKWLMRFGWFRKLVGIGKPKKSGFPSFISKTDETRLQNCVAKLQDKREWVASEKVDGQSGSWALLRHKRHWPFNDDFEYIVCSRNLRLKVKDNSSYWKVSDKYNIEAALRNMIGNRDWIAIQGECVGPKIQGNKYKLTDYEMYVFNLIYPTGRLGSLKAKSIIENKGMNFVPIVNEQYVLPDTIEEALADATGPSALNPDTLREGFVIRSQDGQESWKIVSPEFLLKYNA